MKSRAERFGGWLTRWGAWVLAGGGALLLYVFLDLTEDLFARGEDPSDMLAIDRHLLEVVARARQPGLTHLAVDLTGLGSTLVLGLFTFTLLIMLLMAGARRSALQLLVTSVGAAGLTTLFKHLIARPRPDVVSHLVEVHGASYPSGHALGSAALYLGAALIVAQRWDTWGKRATTLALAISLSLAIACSRVYLGVHYATDASAGVCLGYAWAALVAALVRLSQRHISREKDSEEQPRTLA
jgi:undecaprenyl-diphosphatase